MAIITGAILNDDLPGMSINDTIKGLAGNDKVNGAGGNNGTIVQANSDGRNGAEMKTQLAGIIDRVAGDFVASRRALGRQPRIPSRPGPAGSPHRARPAIATSPPAGGRSRQAHPIVTGWRQA
jgi:hypothetical protein